MEDHCLKRDTGQLPTEAVPTGHWTSPRWVLMEEKKRAERASAFERLSTLQALLPSWAERCQAHCQRHTDAVSPQVARDLAQGYSAQTYLLITELVSAMPGAEAGSANGPHQQFPSAHCASEMQIQAALSHTLSRLGAQQAVGPRSRRSRYPASPSTPHVRGVLACVQP